jgi:Flp pilus assembly protein TadB
MNSERQKRQAEIERIMRQAGTNRETDIAFQEEVRKTAATIIEKEASRTQKREQARRRKRSISPVTAGVWILVLGAVGFIFSVPALAAMLFLCGIALIVWATFPKLSKPPLPIYKNVRSYSKVLKNSVSRLFRKIS